MEMEGGGASFAVARCLFPLLPTAFVVVVVAPFSKEVSPFVRH